MRRILDDACRHFDWVILDAPPVGTVADASILADMADTTLLVVRAADTNYRLTQKAIDAIGRERILGVVLNAVEDMEGPTYGYYNGRRPLKISWRRSEGYGQTALLRRLDSCPDALPDSGRASGNLIAVYAAAAIRFGLPGAVDDPAHEILWRASLIGVVLQICLHYSDLYDFRTLSDRRSMLIGLIQALGSASVVLALLYYWIPDLIIGRGVFVIASAFIVALVAGWRLAFEWLSVRVGPSERLLIVGTGDASVDLARELFSRRHELGVELVGFVDPDPARVGTSLINPGIIGTLEQIPSIVRERSVDRVVVSLADARGKLPMDALLSMKLNAGVQFDHLASVYEEYTGKIAIEKLAAELADFLQRFPQVPPDRGGQARRRLDVSAVGLAVAGAGARGRRDRRPGVVPRSRALSSASASAKVDGSSRFTSFARCDTTRRRERVPCGRRLTIRALRRSVVFFAARGSTSCLSSGTCSSAT